MKTMLKIWGFVILIVFSFSLALTAQRSNVRDVFKTSVPPPGAGKPASSGQVTVIQAALQGIGMGPQGAFAVVSGEVYHEEEEKKGIKVTKIRKREVDIIVNGIESTLRMIPQQEAKGPVATGGDSEMSQGPVGLDRISKSPGPAGLVQPGDEGSESV